MEPDKYTGLMGAWKQIAALGATGTLGFLSFWLIVYEMPAQRQEHAIEAKLDREERAKEREQVMKHAEDAAKQRAAWEQKQDEWRYQNQLILQQTLAETVKSNTWFGRPKEPNKLLPIPPPPK